jgi:hypothetical protein
MKNIFTFLIFFLSLHGFGQDLVQTIRGTVKDKETLEPIIGAKIEITESDPYNAVVSNYDGKFRLESVPIGRQTIIVTFIGYDPVLIRNIDVNSKEVVLTIDMVESIMVMDEVIVTGQKKGEILNKMATVSARSFSVEESKRYAGSLNDVSRMAQNFAGVTGGNDSRNDIIVRGNSPTGILYRIEGIDIPNPNHFARFGTTGGPISMLNNNVLSNSDFLTGAFPAEYGNAIAGVFDLKMRKGNNEQHEFMFQFGFNGAELMAEGPLLKKNGSSYMVSYRYNDLLLFQKLGLNIGTNAVPTYQDVSVKLNFPHKKGVTSIFGIAGASNIELLASVTDSSDLYSIDNSNTYFDTKMGVVGLNHKQRLGGKSYLNMSSGFQVASNYATNDTLDVNLENPFRTYFNQSTISKWTNAIFYNKKFSAKHVSKIGVQSDLYLLSLVDSFYQSSNSAYLTLHNYKGNTFLFQPYLQHQYKPNQRMVVNIGLHYQLLSLNRKGSFEPRAGIGYSITDKDKVTFGYGLHSQMLPMELYFRETLVNGVVELPSKDMDFSKSHHLVLGYSHSFKHGIRIKSEFYYQKLFSIAIAEDSNTYSISNYGSSFTESFPLYLTNNGMGNNYGLDLTLEKFLDKGLYFLVTSSLYQSFYTPSNGVEYNTAFNGNYTFNTLVGYEFKFKKGKNYQTSLTIDLKFTRNGGKRYTPILLAESIAIDKEVRDFENAFTLQYDDYMKGDLRVGFKMVGKKVTQEWALDMQNVTNQKNVFLQQYDNNKQAITTTYQTGRLPIGQYRIYF